MKIKCECLPIKTGRDTVLVSRVGSLLLPFLHCLLGSLEPVHQMTLTQQFQQEQTLQSLQIYFQAVYNASQHYDW